MNINFFKNLFLDLYRQPLRTFLTLSGVVWGTFAIVVLLAFGASVSANVTKEIHGMGSGMILGFPAATTIPYKGFTKGKEVRITPEEVILLKQKVPGLKRVAPEFMRPQRIRFGKEEFNNTVRGVNAEYGEMRNCIPEKGRFINELDENQRRRVCFIGFTLAENLFKGDEPVGKKVFIEGIPFMVVGVLKKKIQNSNYSGQRDEHCAFIPYTTFSSLYGQKYVSLFIVQPNNPAQTALTTEALRQYLGERIGFSPEDKNALFVWDFTEIERSLNVFFLAFTIFLGVIGSFTLMVGGVGVASIMLVVVEERIREIGIKLAVGAKRRQIMWQFFSEAVTIILLGGLIGFFMAWLVIAVLPKELIKEAVGIPQVDIMVGVVTIIVLLLIGVISGLMPARKAASTDPILALRG